MIDIAWAKTRLPIVAYVACFAVCLGAWAAALSAAMLITSKIPNGNQLARVSAEFAQVYGSLPEGRSAVRNRDCN